MIWKRGWYLHSLARWTTIYLNTKGDIQLCLYYWVLWETRHGTYEDLWIWSWYSISSLCFGHSVKLVKWHRLPPTPCNYGYVDPIIPFELLILNDIIKLVNLITILLVHNNSFFFINWRKICPNIYTYIDIYFLSNCPSANAKVYSKIIAPQFPGESCNWHLAEDLNSICSNLNKLKRAVWKAPLLEETIKQG